MKNIDITKTYLSQIFPVTWHTHTHGAAVALLLLLGQDHDRSVRGGNCRRRFRRGQQVRPRKSRGGERGI